MLNEELNEHFVGFIFPLSLPFNALMISYFCIKKTQKRNYVYSSCLMRRYASNALKLTFAGGRSLILSLFMFLASLFSYGFH